MTAAMVGVGPPEAHEARQRLFGALSRALNVEFIPSELSPSSAAALVWFGDQPAEIAVPTIVLGEGRGEPASVQAVRLDRSEALDECLRGWLIRDEDVASVRSLDLARGAETLAHAANLPVWTTQQRDGVRVDCAALVPTELGATEVLRSRFEPGRFFGLLPLVQFLRSVIGKGQWHRPAVRASFVLDDPNLHSVRYGYVDFRRIAREATRVGFHVSVATIPLDGWFVWPKAAQVFRSHPHQLSLLMHGNNHTKEELGDGRDEQARLAMIAQALRRVAALEMRAGVAVDRVMTAPHGRCSEEVAVDMSRLGIESMSITRPFPWLDRPPPQAPLAGWFPADTSTATPTIERVHFSDQPDELPLRAFLGQPIVIYGHHWDLADRPGLLEEWAKRVADLGEIRWSSVGNISRRLVSWRVHGETLHVMPHTRAVDFDVPDNVSHLIVDSPETPGYELTQMSNGLGDFAKLQPSTVLGGQPIELDGRVAQRVRIGPASQIDPRQQGDPAWAAWPIARRILSEGRDRVRPLVDTARRGHRARLAAAETGDR